MTVLFRSAETQPPGWDSAPRSFTGRARGRESRDGGLALEKGEWAVARGGGQEEPHTAGRAGPRKVLPDPCDVLEPKVPIAGVPVSQGWACLGTPAMHGQGLRAAQGRCGLSPDVAVGAEVLCWDHQSCFLFSGI